MNPAILTIIMIMIIFVIYAIYYKIQYRGMTYVRSDIDDKLYLVRDRSDRHHACNMLARLRQNIFKLVNHVKANRDKHQSMDPYILQLFNRIQNVIIRENSSRSKYTSYCINKGEEIVFCLRIRKHGKLHDINLLMYVVIHEISHVACPEEGHTDLFNQIFEFLCRIGITMGLYKKIPFNDSPVDYCGMMITDSIV